MLGLDINKEIGQTIINQIKYADVWFLPSVGATKFTYLESTNEFQ